jgi:uncharacterized protein
MIRLSWLEVETAAHQLAQKIKDSGFDPDCLIGITTGGLFPLAMLAKRIKDKSIYTITTKRHWDDKNDWIDIKYMPDVDLQGKSVLLIDEITHVGTTIQTVAEVLRTQYKVSVVKTATLAANHDVTDSRPDYHVLAEQSDWLLFPWEEESEFEAYDLHLPVG